MILAFTVPGPPVPKMRARVFPRKRRDGSTFIASATPEKSADYEKHVALIARGALSHLSAWNPAGPHELVVRVYRAQRRGDLDNFVKSAGDALNASGVWIDDRTVTKIQAEMFDDKLRPRLEVEVRCL